MDKLIDYTAFTGELSLALANNFDYMNNLIADKQEDYLIKVLGEVEYLNFANDLTGIVPASQKWVDFLDGKTLTVTDKTGTLKQVQYKGFKNLLAYFMFCEYLNNPQMTAAGNVRQSIEFTHYVNPSDKYTLIFNKAVALYGMDWRFEFTNYNAENSKGIYCAASHANNYYEFINPDVERLKGSVYNYLYYTQLADNTSFPDWKFYHEEKINQFNL